MRPRCCVEPVKRTGRIGRALYAAEWGRNAKRSLILANSGACQLIPEGLADLLGQAITIYKQREYIVFRGGWSASFVCAWKGSPAVKPGAGCRPLAPCRGPVPGHSSTGGLIGFNRSLERNAEPGSGFEARGGCLKTSFPRISALGRSVGALLQHLPPMMQNFRNFFSAAL